MKTPLRYPGGKSRAVKHILPLIPEDCGELCSPFLGGGSIELAVAERGTKVYGYDIFAPLVWFWEALLEDPERLATLADSYRVQKEYSHKGKIEIKKGLPPELFKEFRDEIRAELAKDNPQFSFDLAAKVYAINRSSFSGETLSGGFSKRASYARFTDSSIDRIRDFEEPNIFVRRMDFKESIAKHPDAFLYLDPPYYLGKSREKLYGNKGDTHFTFDHDGLYDSISNRTGWVLSYNDCEYVREKYSNYKIIPAAWAYGMKNMYTDEELVRREILEETANKLEKYNSLSKKNKLPNEVIKSIRSHLKNYETKKMGSSSEVIIIG